MNRPRELKQLGQSIWLDYIRRSLIIGGDLQRLVDEDGVSGVTINPTIFQKAVEGSADYDDALLRLLAAETHIDARALYERLIVEDAQLAADVFRPIYDRTDGDDGFVSLEVSPYLAGDTGGTIAEARRFWQAVGRSNLMIKVPATPAGIPAIEALIAEGINVNITLMFSLSHYEAVARAYLTGLSRSPDPHRVASVASFFVSRVDTVVDHALERIGTSEALALRGKGAIANAKAVYRRFREIFSGEPFATLRRRGARVQRPLWASTGTKNPAYSDVLYVEELIGPDTVNTVPPAALNAFRDHGRPRAALTERFDDAAAVLKQLAALGINLEAIGQQLQVDGVAAFAASFDHLLATLDDKRKALLQRQVDRLRLDLGSHAGAVTERLRLWQSQRMARRLWDKDPTLWSAVPVPELTNRMGWFSLPEVMHEHLDDLTAFAREVQARGTRDVVLLGMGGSSLAPEVFQRTFGAASGHPDLIVLDSTHPDAVRTVESRIDLRHTLFLVSSKSGTTTETLSFFRYFWDRVSRITKTPGEHFVAITDPQTPLVGLAHQHAFRRVFAAPADIGGRYSALSVFGLVPAALLGLDVHRILDRAWTMAEACAFCVAEPENPGLALGAALGELTLAGRDKVTFLASPSLAAFPAWAEQLIAESTGKDGRGIIPVGDEPPGPPTIYGGDRVFVHLRLDDDDHTGLDDQVAALEAAGHPRIRIQLAEKADLGQEFFRWEVGVAAAGAVIGIHPFNQPDVELAKELARKAMVAAAKGRDNDSDVIRVDGGSAFEKAISAWLSSARIGDYVAVQGYLAPRSQTDHALQHIRLALRDRTHLATTVGYGPRFLHSTGQLHKGGPNTGLFLQLLDEPTDDLPVPGTDYTFAELIHAQALGDSQALVQRRRRVVRVMLGKNAPGALAHLAEVLRG